MNINLSPSQQLEIFSKVDKNGNASLQMTEFLMAILELKKLLIEESIQKLGLAISDLVLSFVISIVILLLMFVFIFIGIVAFSPTSSFSSVTNSLLPLAAGGAVNGDSKTEEKDEDLKEVAD